MSIVRVEKECTIKCDFCWTRIQPGTEYYVNMIGAGVDAEEEYRCQDCDKAPILADCEKSAINALDPALTPLCVSFVGMQETSSRAFGLYNIEEALCDDLPLHSTVSLQTIAVHGFRPVMV